MAELRRYPGPVPFSEEYMELFFGREDDISLLGNLIKLNTVTVLFGRSGIGKSSLIEAGLCPLFEKPVPQPSNSIPEESTIIAKSFKIIKIRYMVNTDIEKSSSLVAQLITQLQNYLEDSPLFMPALKLPTEEISAWQLFKSLQWKYHDEFAGILLIMDQFEQIFNATANEISQLNTAIAEIVYNRPPAVFAEPFQKLIDEELAPNKKSLLDNEAGEFQLNLLQNGLRLHFLLGIRSDKLYQLDDLGTVIPDIFRNRYHLKRLPVEKLKHVICSPATAQGPYLSRPFLIDEDVIKTIESFLTVRVKNRRPEIKIETFLLQIVCQHLEDQAICRQEANKTVELQVNDVSNLKDISKNYYLQIFKNRPGITVPDTVGVSFDGFEALQVWYLIERKLIDEKTMSRVCLDKVFINSLGFDEGLLERLTETRIVRREINTVSGESYELSHDSFIDPITEVARDEKHYGSLSDSIAIHYETMLSKFSPEDKKQIKQLISTRFLDTAGNLQTIALPASEIRRELLHRLIREKTIIRIEYWDRTAKRGRRYYYVLNEIYKDAAFRMGAKDTGIKQMRKYRTVSYLAIASLILLGTFFWLLRNSWLLYFRYNASTTAQKIFIKPDDEQNGIREKIFLLGETFTRLRKQPKESLSASNKLVSEFLNSKLLGKRISMPGKLVGSFMNGSEDGVFLVSYIDKDTMSGVANYTPDNSFIPPSEKPKDITLYWHKGDSAFHFNNVLEGGFVENAPYMFIRTQGSLSFYAISNSAPPKLTDRWAFKFSWITKTIQKEKILNNISIKKYIPQTVAYLQTTAIQSFFSQLKANVMGQQIHFKVMGQQMFYSEKEHLFFTIEPISEAIQTFNDQLQPIQRWQLQPGETLIPPNDYNSPYIYSYGQEKNQLSYVQQYNILGERMARINISAPIKNASFDQGHYLIIQTAQKSIFLNPNLNQLPTSINGTLATDQLQTVVSRKSDVLILSNSNLALYHPKEKTDSITLNDFIIGTSFSIGGDTVFAKTTASIYLLDRHLNILNRFPCDGCTVYNNVILSNYNSYLMLTDFQDPMIKSVNGDNPESIVTWIRYQNREKWHLNDSIYKKYNFAQTGVYNIFRKLAGL
ncbi:MAG: hypothetical protein JO154_12460 [Chitinophaga sp.]|uniref:nSTAND1 domain-containing NTPase n=1 Tax=Chitinophaga sp. TaxID=1869181 RepID=UPI0025C5ED92|nr:hypothetical protein [Chitinophaga sp.]MBV8253412.1 hypothetical protein [Chitinophaga sp.]